MFCNACGMKNPDGAKFCAYCGAKLVEPEDVPVDDFDEWDEGYGSEPEAPEEEFVEEAVDIPEWGAESRFDEPSASKRIYDEDPEAGYDDDEYDEDLEYDEDDAESAEDDLYESEESGDAVDIVPEKREPSASVWAKPTERESLKPVRGGNSPSTIVPKRGNTRETDEDILSGDLFFDAYDEDEDELPPEPVRRPRNRRDITEARREKFWEKNIGSVIGILLTVGTLLVVGVWLFFIPSGQRLMARLGISKDAKAYASVASEAYGSMNYQLAAKNYYQALLLDDDNIEYALYTAECYRMAGENGSAATALTKAIDINASDARAYRMLKELYPNKETRPKAVSELLQQGATLVNDYSLTE